MNPTRLKGLAALGVSGLAYSNLMMLSLMMGPTIPMATIAASALYGMYSFSDKEYVSAIEALENGGLKLTIQKSVFASYTIYTNVEHVMSICALGDDDMGADDCEGNMITVSKFTDAQGDHQTGGVFTLPGDAFRDKEFMEWILAAKDEETTNSEFSDLVK
jgi:hypothetical protein